MVSVPHDRPGSGVLAPERPPAPSPSPRGATPRPRQPRTLPRLSLQPVSYADKLHTAHYHQEPRKSATVGVRRRAVTRATTKAVGVAVGGA